MFRIFSALKRATTAEGRTVAAPESRSQCTDVVCLLLFVANLIGLGFLLYISVPPQGDLNKVLGGLDYANDLCGRDNSAEATGEPINTTVILGQPSIWQRMNLFVPLPPRRTVTVRRGGRDHRSRPYLYMSFPTLGTMDGLPSVAMCVDSCPHPADQVWNRTAPNGTITDIMLERDNDPSQFICTGRYYGSQRARCRLGDGGDGASAASFGSHDGSLQCAFGPSSLPPTSALYHQPYGRSQIELCNDQRSDCEVCFPPYSSAPVATFCMPDPRHALRTFAAVVTAVGASAASVADAARGDDGVPSEEELLRLRESVHSLPSLVYEDLALSWPVVLGCIATTIVFYLIWMMALRACAHTMVWLIIGAIGAGLGVGAFCVYEVHAEMRASARYGRAGEEVYTQRADVLHVCFYFLAVFGCLYALCVLWLRAKIVIAVKVMKEATKVIDAHPVLLLLPMLILGLMVLFAAYALVVALLIVSLGDLIYGEPGYGHLYLSDRLWGCLVGHLAGCFWVLVFVRHVQHATVAGTVAAWYFSPDRSQLHPCCPVATQLRIAVSRHAGSIACGSLLISLLQLLQLCVALVIKRLSSLAGDSSLAKLACCCAICCLGCVDRSVRYLSRQAYVLMMVQGTPFCSSAIEALSLLTKHMVKVALVRSIGSAFLLLGKLFVTAAAATVGALWMITQPPYADELYSIWPPVIAIAIGAWIVSYGFMSVFNMAVDAIFLCYVLDLERSAHGAPAQHCDASLQELLEPHPAVEHSHGEVREVAEGLPAVVTIASRGPARRPVPGAGNPFGVPIGRPISGAPAAGIPLGPLPSAWPSFDRFGIPVGIPLSPRSNAAAGVEMHEMEPPRGPAPGRGRGAGHV